MDDISIASTSMSTYNIETAAQVKVLKGANEQLESVVGTLLDGIADLPSITGKGGLIDIVA